MNALDVKIERLSDVFQPRDPLISRRADKLTFMFDSTKSGRRLRHVILHAVTVSNEAEILFECFCSESESMKTFRFSRICSDIEYEGKKYAPTDFLLEGLGISEESYREAVQKASAYAHIRDNFDKLVGEALADAAAIWTGSAQLAFKFRGKKQALTLKSVFVLGTDDHYLWGYSERAAAFMFVPLAAIDGKIIANDTGFQKKTFLLKFLGLS